MTKHNQQLSLVDPTDNQQFLHRLQQLQPESRAIWGKMTVNQMLRHCLLPLELAAGEREIPVNRMMAFFGPISKLLFTKQRRFGKNLPTAPGLIIRNQPEFEATRQAVSEKVAYFGRHGITAYSTKPHPLFGPMTPSEWNMLQSKHLDHHLRQFGV